MRIFKTKKIMLAVLAAMAMMATLPVLQSCSNEFESNENLDKIEFNHKVIALADKYDLHIKLPLKVNNYDEKTLDSITKYMEARVKVKNKKFTQTLQLDKSFKNQFKYRLAKNNIRFKANTPENGGWRIEETNWLGWITEYVVVNSNNGNYSVEFSAVNNSFQQVGQQEITIQGHFICYKFYGNVTSNYFGVDFVDAVMIMGYCNTLTGTGSLTVEYN